MNYQTLLQQIGGMNLLAISGGRLVRKDNALHLPCSVGREVVITLDADDTYRVRRNRLVFRGAKRGQIITEHEVSGIYADQIGEAAYRASIAN